MMGFVVFVEGNVGAVPISCRGGNVGAGPISRGKKLL